MDYTNYERHPGLDSELPIIFRFFRTDQPHQVLVHWHENIEILCFTGGSGGVACGSRVIPVQAGDTVIVNSNELHGTELRQGVLEYYYLIPDVSICQAFGLNMRELRFRNYNPGDREARALFEEIHQELSQQAPGYKPAVKAAILRLLVHFLREGAAEEDGLLNLGHSEERIAPVKKALRYIQLHEGEAISLEQLCEHVGLSKYYFCRTFHQVTGMTPVEYINCYRCQRAQRLLRGGKHTITQAAEEVGFQNLSYFYRVYKRYLNRLPSQELQKD